MHYSLMLQTLHFSSSSVVSRTFSALCVYSKFGNHPHPLEHLCAKFRFFQGLHCWASPWRKITYSISQSITHSPTLSRNKKQTTRIIEFIPGEPKREPVPFIKQIAHLLILLMNLQPAWHYQDTNHNTTTSHTDELLSPAYSFGISLSFSQQLLVCFLKFVCIAIDLLARMATRFVNSTQSVQLTSKQLPATHQQQTIIRKYLQANIETYTVSSVIRVCSSIHSFI